MCLVEKSEDWEFCSYDVINRLLFVLFIFSHKYFYVRNLPPPHIGFVKYNSHIIWVEFLSSTSGIRAPGSRNWSEVPVDIEESTRLWVLIMAVFRYQSLSIKIVAKKLVDRIRLQGWSWSVSFVMIGS